MSIENKVNKYKEILDILPTPQEKYEYLVDQANLFIFIKYIYVLE